MSEARRLTAEQVEERRTNLRAFRKELEMEGDQTFNTTLQMQEEWLATVDALLARERELVAALKLAKHKAEQIRDGQSNPEQRTRAIIQVAAGALAQGKKT